MKNLSLALLAATFLSACAPVEKSHEYHLTGAVALTGDEGWDYVTVDAAARRVYIAHTSQVEVLDADSGKPVGVISDLSGVHGIAIAADEGVGFITSGKANKVTEFNLKTLAKLGEAKTGRKPDAITYDPATHRIFAFNGESNSATVIDAKSDKKLGSINLKGEPEFAVADGQGHIFVNIEDEDELLRIDAESLKVLNRWKVAPGDLPTSLAIDRENNRLFIGCRNHVLMVMNAEDGAILASLPIGERVDATVFDRQTKDVVSSNGDGSITIIKQESPDHYHVTGNVLTQRSSRTLGLDEKTHRLFIPAADFELTPPATPDNPFPRPPQVAGTFKVLIFDRQ